MSLDSAKIAYNELVEARVNRIVDEFEDAREHDDQVDVASFLPRKDDADYAAIGLELLRVDLHLGWRNSKPRPLSHYQKWFPEILKDRATLAELAFEEYRMRRISGQRVSPTEYSSRLAIDTSRWPRVEDSTVKMRSPVASTKIDMGHGRSGKSKTSLRPDALQPGDRFLDFELVCELGVGAFAKVFLAKQSELADRLVVLKITANKGAEADRLARLQHTNIVPVHSVHTDGELNALCMPNFGPCTLADALAHIQQLSEFPADGDVFKNAIAARCARIAQGSEQSQNAISVKESSESTNVDYLNACVSICQQIAAAICHAHAQRVVHGDLKPANVLLSNHGPVMLLDFNLADDVDQTAAHRSIVGGTLPYAAPEHLLALLNGERPQHSSDLYSLGMILFELLCGQLPFPSRPGSSELTIREMIADRQLGPPSLRSINPRIPSSLDALVVKLLSPNPSDRYQEAKDIRDDLQRHLDHRPLRHIPNRSVSERIQKWNRRHPRFSATVIFSTAIVVCLAVTVFALILHLQNLRNDRLLAAAQHLAKEIPKIRAYTSIPNADKAWLRRGLKIAEEAVAPFTVSLPAGEPTTKAGISWPTSGTEADSIADSVSECLYLMANAHLQLAHRQSQDDLLRAQVDSAWRLNQQAAIVSRTNSGFDTDAIQRQAEEIAALQQGRSIVPKLSLKARSTVFVDAVDLIHRRQFNEAIAILETLRQNDPFDLSIWFELGFCYSQIERLHEAEACFSMCATMWKDSYVAFFQRGAVRLKLKKYAEAEADFSRVIAVEPKMAVAYLNRAVARRQLSRYDAAISDLSDAIELGSAPTRAYFMRSEILKRLGRKAEALKDYQRGLKQEPIDELSFVRRGIALMKTDPPAALRDFQSALEINPFSYAALRNSAFVVGEKLQRPNEAIAFLNRILKFRPESYSDIVSRGVMYARLGKRESAIVDGEESLTLSRDPKTKFQVACIHALTARSENDKKVAISLLQESISANEKWARFAKIDHDLDALRAMPEFQDLISDTK